MASLNKRKEMVNQLRKAHFQLGFQQNNQPMSEYDHKYPQHPIVIQNSKKLNPREHHYQLGNEDDKNYQSEFKTNFNAPKNLETAKLSPDMINDLRNEHFQFGYHDKAKQSQYNDHFYKKPLPIQNKQQTKENNLSKRKHNHEFGDTLTYFSSTYNQKHNKNISQNTNNNENKPIIDANLFRKTNMVLGNQQPNYLTQNANTYTAKVNQGYKPMKFNDANIQLGKDQNQYKSSNKTDFTHKQHQAIKVDKNRIRDFKSAHFHISQPHLYNQYQSEHQGQFYQKQLNIIEPASKPATNVQISMDHAPTTNSIYKDAFLGKPAQKPELCRLAGQLNSVSLGSDPNNFVSEGKASYVKHPISDNSLNEARKNQLKGVTVHFGNHAGDYSTQHKETYANRFLQHKRAGMTEQHLQQLKKKHFEHGYQDVDYIKSSQKYGEKFGPANKLDEKVQKGMRITNMHDFDPDVKKQSTYNHAFHWKKNVDF